VGDGCSSGSRLAGICRLLMVGWDQLKVKLAKEVSEKRTGKKRRRTEISKAVTQ
jgi:hypothetical protein